MRRVPAAVTLTLWLLLAAPAAWGLDWGADAFSAPPGAIEDAEGAMGATFESYSIYGDIDRPEVLQDVHTQRAVTEKALIYLNINSTIRNDAGKPVAICWSAVAAGHRDGQLHAWTQAILALGYPSFLITFNHEPTWKSYNQPKCAPKYDNPTTYKLAYNHVRNLFKADGVTAPWAYVMSAGATKWPGGLAYRPAPRNFQVIGTDQYYHCNDAFQDPPEALKSFFAWTAKYAPAKPVLVGEIGANTKCPDQSLVWLAAAKTRLLAHNVLAVNWNLRTDARFLYNPMLQPDIKAWWLDWASQETGDGG